MKKDFEGFSWCACHVGSSFPLFTFFQYFNTFTPPHVTPECNYSIKYNSNGM